jgi:hypothetical protein
MTTPRRTTATTRRAVYDGQDRLGDVEQHGAEYIARDRRGKSLGRFDSALEAANAISKAAGEP